MANLTIEQLTSFTGTPQNTDLIIIHDGNNAKKITYAELLTKIFSGSTSLQADGSQFNLTGHIIPTTNNAYDLGNAEYKFRDLYLSSNSLYLGSTSVSESDYLDKPILRNSAIPSNPNDTGTKGEIRYDDNYMYICILENTWKRFNIESAW